MCGFGFRDAELGGEVELVPHRRFHGRAQSSSIWGNVLSGQAVFRSTISRKVWSTVWRGVKWSSLDW